jgi:glycosyltransferase involved in cell wall biosynthesis
MTNKLLTIAIPTYNRVAKLEQLIMSIVPQLTPLVEILVSDNASTDGTAGLMTRLASDNASIRTFRQSANLGLDRNVESAVVNSFGRYVWICGDDDEFEPFAIEYICNVLQSGDFATGWVNCSRWDAELKECWAPKIIDLDEDILGADIGAVISASHIKFSFLSSHIVRREFWLNAKGREKCFVPPFTECIWMLGHLLAGVNRNNFVIARPLLRQRSSEYDNVSLAKIPVFLNWCRVMGMAVELGVPKRDVEPFFLVSANGPHLINNIIHKKRFAPEAAVQEFIPTLRIFWRYPSFWLKAFPFYIMPAFFIRCLRKIYMWQRKLGGIQIKLRDK